MKTRLIGMFLVVLVMIAAPVFADATPQKPGQWKITTQVEMPGVDMEMPPMEHSFCFTEEDLKDPKGAIPTDANSDCDISDYKLDGNTMTWTMDCPSQDMKGTGKITFNSDGTGYNGAMEMSMGGQKMSAKYTAKHEGACKK